MLSTIRPIGLVLMLVLSLSSAAAHAAPLSVGDDIKFLNGPGTTGGGEFTALVNGTASSFITFCLQQTEYINFVDVFNVDSISTYVLTDPTSRGGDVLGRDYLSAQTAFLYTKFRAGTLTGYDYSGTSRWQSANNLQNAIWMFEEEMAMSSSNPFVVLANNAMSLGLWSGLGDVRVMNLSLNGREAQDQLVLVPPTAVPEPASLILLGSGLWLAAAAQRRRGTPAAKANA